MNKPNKSFFIEYQRDRYNKKILRIYDLLAKLAIKYGCMGKYPCRYTDDQIQELWEYDFLSCPTITTLIKYAKISIIKWIIRNKIKVNYPIWTPDFLHGVAQNGALKWGKRFPVFKWCSNNVLLRLIKMSPYAGKLLLKSTGDYNKWSYVPAFYLPYSCNSSDYLAGVLAGGRMSNKNGKIYARYTYAAKAIEAAGIPIEYSFYSGGKIKHILISPFWPAIFSYKMPKEIGEPWLDIYNAAEANTYASILWLFYFGKFVNYFTIPYLISRRQMFYVFKCEEGMLVKLEKMRIEKKMTQLDARFEDAIMYWIKKGKENYEKENQEKVDNKEADSNKLQAIGTG